jgi:hypothetical protein
MVVAQEGAKKKQGKKKAPDAAGMNAKCPMSGGPVKNDKFANFGGGKVYFCCDNCVTKFNTMKAKMNFQLVQTKQVSQVGCPISGSPKVTEGTAIDVDGVPVSFCCKNCKAKAEKMVKEDKDAAMLTLFGGKNYGKAFKTPWQIKMAKERAKMKKAE